MSLTALTAALASCGGGAGQNPAGGVGGNATSGAGGNASGTGGSGTGGSGTGGSAPSDIPATKVVGSDKPRDEAPAVESSAYDAFVASTNTFGFEVFHQATKQDENAIFSPCSVAVALGMAYAGARGNTASQMQQVLHDTAPAGSFHLGMNRLTLDLAARDIAVHGTAPNEKSVRLSLVDSLWGEVTYKFHPEFLDILGVQYGAGMHVVDFLNAPEAARIAINTDIAAATEEKIQNLIPQGIIDNHTHLVLTNTVYLKASWSQVFSKIATYDAPFHSLSAGDELVPTMHDTRDTSYMEDASYQMVELGYDGGKLSMDVVLPAEGHFAEVRDQLSAAWLTQATTKLAQQKVALAIPKLHFVWGSTSLVPALRALGMPDAFDGNIANFSGIGDEPLAIAEVLHKAFVDVDESGTEAAAATAVIFADAGAALPPMDPPRQFIANRPFLFLIRDASGAVLFIGQVIDPKVGPT